jgi:hypothetical protein
VRVLLVVLLIGCGFERGAISIDDATTTTPADAAEQKVDVLPVDACSGCPANDVPGGAQPITGTTSPVITADFATAHDDVSISCGTPGGRDLFYELVVPSSGAQVVYVDTNLSVADTAVALFAGPCVAPGEEKQCSNDPCAPAKHSMLAASLKPGTYCLVVEEVSSAVAAGTGVTLDAFFAERDGVQLTGSTPYTVNGDTCTSDDFSDPLPSCEMNANNPGMAKDQMYWYLKCAGATTPAASTCGSLPTNVDTIVTVRGRGTGTINCIDDGCGTPDRGSLLVHAGIGGPTLVQVIVDGWDQLCGTYTLTVTP